MTQTATILVAGPTASGKSALAAMLAERLQGTVINCDAMQVYRDLPVLTAQPGAELRRQAPHLLYATIDPAQAYSAGQWLAAAREAIDEARGEKGVPVICGGTGMYFQSLIKGLADIPEIPAELRQKLQADYAAEGEIAIRERLAKADPLAAQTIKRGDRLRLLRALEIVLATRKTQRDWQSSMSGGIGARHVIPVLLLPPRAALYEACDRRFEAMVKRGAATEAKALLERDLPLELPAMKIIGVREIGAFLAGRLSWEQAQAEAQQATRNYAKRQMTWFRNQWVSNKIGFQRPLLMLEEFYAPSMAENLYAFCQKELQLQL